jgi:hypothetical protein
MELDWDSIKLPQKLLDDPNFKTAVKIALRSEWSPPEGMIQNYDKWYENYLIWHAHLIPIEDFKIPLEKAIETKGLPYYSPAENPEKEKELYIVRDNKNRLDLIKHAKDKYDARWYMILHGCFFNATTIWLIVNELYPKLNWKAIESNGHVLITTGTKEQLYDYLYKNGDNNFYIADPVVSGKENIAKLMKDIKTWKVYDDVYNYHTKCYKEFYF